VRHISQHGLMSGKRKSRMERVSTWFRCRSKREERITAGWRESLTLGREEWQEDSAMIRRIHGLASIAANWDISALTVEDRDLQ
jgi:hypothetical protein